MVKNKFKIEGFQLPYQTVTIVPCTKDADTTISKKQCSIRANEVKKELGKIFGGFTEIQAQGGYYSEDKNKLIEEPVFTVTSFARRKNFTKNKDKWLEFVKKKGREWGQESMGVILENDLVYVDTKSKK